MANERETGGPAFPTVDLLNDGMTLRDYFAAKALAGVFQGGDTEIHDDVMARRCYELADAMLKERAK